MWGDFEIEEITQTTAGNFVAVTTGSLTVTGQSEMTDLLATALTTGTLDASTIRLNGEELSKGLWTEDGSNIYYDVGNGNVGIGTANPTAKLQVQGTVELNVMPAPVSGASEGIVKLGRVDNPAVRFHQIRPRMSQNGGQFNWIAFDVHNLNGNAGLTEVLRLRGDGRVGIGTASPGYKLDVNGDINCTGQVRVNGTSISGSNWNEINSDLYYDAGNVGIGTSVPGTILDVNGSFRVNHSNFSAQTLGDGSNGIFTLSNTANQNVRFRMAVAGVNKWDIAHSDDINYNYFTSFPSAATRFTIKGSTGNVGIGTNNPGYKLDVNGSINATELRVNGVALNSNNVVLKKIEDSPSVYYNHYILGNGYWGLSDPGGPNSTRFAIQSWACPMKQGDVNVSPFSQYEIEYSVTYTATNSTDRFGGLFLHDTSMGQTQQFNEGTSKGYWIFQRLNGNLCVLYVDGSGSLVTLVQDTNPPSLSLNVEYHYKVFVDDISITFTRLDTANGNESIGLFVNVAPEQFGLPTTWGDVFSLGTKGCAAKFRNVRLPFN